MIERLIFSFVPIKSTIALGVLVWKGDEEAMTEPPQDVSQKERRKYPRAKIAIAIEFKPESATVASRAETADLSLAGCYVEMSFTLPVGTKLDVILWVEDERLAGKGIVVTHHPQFGNGIEFLEMSKEDQSRLADYLKKCEAECEKKPEANASG
jgi:c-di-GMP-binding flagellar brake protein YcgR